jgi:fructokinase
MRMPQIYTIGETTYDIQFKDGNPIGGCGGGSAFNSAISLGRCGLPVSLISTFGRDRIGDLAFRMLKDNGVNCNLIKRYEGQSRVALAFFDERRNPEYSFYPASREVIPDYPEPQQDDIILLGSSFALRDKGRDDLLRFLGKAQTAGCCIIYDPNARRHLADDPDFISKILENISFATIVKGSDEDFHLIFNESNSKEVYEKIWKAGTNYLFYTKGPGGAELFTPDFQLEEKSPEINVISTIGAGDNFSAGLVYGIYSLIISGKLFKEFNQDAWQKIIEYGIYFASEVCQSPQNYISVEAAASLK